VITFRDIRTPCVVYQCPRHLKAVTVKPRGAAHTLPCDCKNGRPMLITDACVVVADSDGVLRVCRDRASMAGFRVAAVVYQGRRAHWRLIEEARTRIAIFGGQ